MKIISWILVFIIMRLVSTVALCFVLIKSLLIICVITWLVSIVSIVSIVSSFRASSFVMLISSRLTLMIISILRVTFCIYSSTIIPIGRWLNSFFFYLSGGIEEWFYKFSKHIFTCFVFNFWCSWSKLRLYSSRLSYFLVIAFMFNIFNLFSLYKLMTCSIGVVQFTRYSLNIVLRRFHIWIGN